MKKEDKASLNREELIIRWVQSNRRVLVVAVISLILLAVAVLFFWGWQKYSQHSNAKQLALLQQKADAWGKDIAAVERQLEQQKNKLLLEQQEQEQPENTASATDSTETEGVSAAATPDNNDDSSNAASESAPAADEETTRLQLQSANLNSAFSNYLDDLLDSRSAVVKSEALWWKSVVADKKDDFQGRQQALAAIYSDYPDQIRAEQSMMLSANLYFENGDEQRAVELWQQLRAGESAIALAAVLELALVKMKNGEYAESRQFFDYFLEQIADQQELKPWEDMVTSQLIALDILEGKTTKEE